MTRLYGDLGALLQEQHRQYEAYYVLRFTPGATVDEIPGRAANQDETVPVGGARESGRPVAEVEDEIAQITEALERGSSSAEEDGEPEGGDKGGLVPDSGPVSQERASEGGSEQVLDPRFHASLTPCLRNSLQVPMAYLHMLYVLSNYQGRLHLQSSPPLD